MRRFARTLAVAVLLAVASLSILISTTSAAGPQVGSGPWIDGTGLVSCLDPGTHPLFNTQSQKGHCFKD